MNSASKGRHRAGKHRPSYSVELERRRAFKKLSDMMNANPPVTKPSADVHHEPLTTSYPCEPEEFL